MNGATSSTTAVIPNNRVNQLVGDLPSSWQAHALVAW